MRKRYLTGRVLAGRFSIIDKLGEGAMAVVYLARHDVLRRKVAVKLLRQKVQAYEPFVERFRREARAASRLNHPNIVYISDFGRTEEGRFYLVMEYVPGQSLREVMEEAEGGVLPIPRALDILAQIAGALEAAHEAGVVHRDLKPENVRLCEKYGGGEQVKILDFGLAKILEDPDLPQLTQRGEIFGTPAYMSPEQGAGRPVDKRTDIYSFGVLAFEMFTGQVPFGGKSLPEILIAQLESDPVRPSAVRSVYEALLPEELDRLIFTCLQKDPRQRPSTVKEVRRVIDRLLEHAKESFPSMARLPTVAALRESVDEPWDDTATVEMEEPRPERSELVPTDPSLLGKESSPSLRRYLWDQICKAARFLALAMRDMRLGTVELTKVLALLGEAEEKVLAREMELALLSSRLEDLEEARQQREARLRNAVVDLRMERSRLASEGREGSGQLKELDRQVTQVERRLAEVIAESELERDRIGQEIAGREAHLANLYRLQLDQEMKLLGLLRETKPADAPSEILDAFSELDKLLASWG